MSVLQDLAPRLHRHAHTLCCNWFFFERVTAAMVSLEECARIEAQQQPCLTVGPSTHLEDTLLQDGLQACCPLATPHQL